MLHTNPPKLKRTLNLPLLVFYGLGTTIGAGIYVLVGAAAGRAGIYARVAFILAAIGCAGWFLAAQSSSSHWLANVNSYPQQAQVWTHFT